LEQEKKKAAEEKKKAAEERKMATEERKKATAERKMTAAQRKMAAAEKKKNKKPKDKDSIAGNPALQNYTMISNKKLELKCIYNQLLFTGSPVQPQKKRRKETTAAPTEPSSS